MKIDSKKYPLPRRLRHHTAPNLYLPFEEIKDNEYYPPLIENIDWPAHFSNAKGPDVLDVGCGKGAFLLDYSEQNPEWNYLGIEVRESVVEWLSGVIKGEQLANVDVIWYSVVNSLKFINSQSVSEIFYLFPDPWSKRKHLKRRAFIQPVLEEYHRVLKDSGRLHLATDVPEVHDYHKKTLEKSGLFDYTIINSDAEWNKPITNKEKFCRKNDIPIFRIIADRK